MHRSRLICLAAVFVIVLLACVPASALEASTLYKGSRGEAVRRLQQALIDRGYLSGKADGIFGKMTEQAVIAFQRANQLTPDGLAGKKTQALLFGSGTSAAADPAPAPVSEPAPAAVPAPAQPSESVSGSGLFGGNYTSLRIGERGDRVRILQQALIDLKYLTGKADGIFGKQTQKAVISFQHRHRLTEDGVAGKKTMQALENDLASGAAAQPSAEPAASPAAEPASSPSAAAESQPVSSVAKVSAPDQGSIRLLHWFNDIKPVLKNGEHLLVYDPSTGISWTLRVMSRGRHCDCEPLTKADTEAMVRAFGNRNTWTQKGVYVRLPGGTWTVASTHDMPHMSGSIKDNGFDGHLCVHFLRDMAEAQENDPNYGVANQKTIRELWKRISGEEISF